MRYSVTGSEWNYCTATRRLNTDWRSKDCARNIMVLQLALFYMLTVATIGGEGMLAWWMAGNTAANRKPPCMKKGVVALHLECWIVNREDRGLSPPAAASELGQFQEQCRLEIRKYSFLQRTINGWNWLSKDCVNASVNMNKNKIYNYLRRAGYT